MDSGYQKKKIQSTLTEKKTGYSIATMKHMKACFCCPASEDKHFMVLGCSTIYYNAWDLEKFNRNLILAEK